MLRTLLVQAVAILLAVGVLMAREDKPKDPESQAVIQKAIQAHGGADKLARLQTMRWKFSGAAEINGGTVRFTAEAVTRLPDHQRVTITVAGETDSILRVLAGEKAWQRADGQTRELKDEELADFRASVHLTYLRSLLPLRKDPACSVAPVGEVKVQDRPAVGLRVSAKGQADVNLFFDKGTGLLVKSERRALGLGQQEITLETFYSDYKEVEGVQYPMTLVLHHDGRHYMKQEVSEVRFEEQIEDSEFSKP